MSQMHVLPWWAAPGRAFAQVLAAVAFSASFGVTPASAAAPEFSITSVPGWVKPIAVDWVAKPQQKEVSDGVHYLLADMQVRVGKTERTVFRRVVATALNEHGVQSLGNVEAGFDPSYQTLALHSITVHRQGRAIQKLVPSAVRMLQREKELEYRIYDGTKTANVFIDDLRVGDSVEYAYSVTGNNPVFANHQFGRFELQWGIPIANVYRRLLMPAGRELTLRNHNSAIQPKVAETADGREYVWALSNQSALAVESDAPSWFDPFASVDWSEFGSWNAVSRWAEPLYRVPSQFSPAMQAAVDQIARAGNDPGDRLVAALRFVQREVRYLGVEVGPGSHAPNPPQLVLERRFGDCKDKTMLTIALLRRLGIEAQPALVSTSLRRKIEDLAPSPGAFNHVIVHARVAGRDYWLDPTRAPQEGTLQTVSQANFGAALIVDAATDRLAAMPAPSGEQIKRDIDVEFDMQAGFDKPARMTVHWVARGSSADSVRSAFASQSPTELQKQYLNFYARYYPKISVAEPFASKDDKAANRIEVTEQYWVEDVWKKNPDDPRDHFTVHVADIRSFLELPRESIRKAPLGVVHPIDMTLVTRLLLPARWTSFQDNDKIDDPAFSFQQSVSSNGNRFSMTNRFVSRVDVVEAGDVSRYMANIEKARGVAGYRLYRDGEQSAQGKANAAGGGWATLPLLVGLLSLGGLGWLAWKLYRYDPEPPHVDSGPFRWSKRGLGGWLLLVGFGVIVSPVRLVYDLFTVLPAYQADRWAAVTTVGSAAYHPALAPLLTFELVANVALMFGSVLIVMLFFTKRTSLPKIYIGYMVLACVVQVVDLAVLTSLPKTIISSEGTKVYSDFARTLVAALIWCTYMLRSTRVKQTFIERLVKPAVLKSA